MSRRSELQRDFQFVRRTFFPRWDKAQLWRCRFADRRRRLDGLCVPERRTIYVAKAVSNRIGVLVHEICHAVTPGLNHGPSWQRRMLKVACAAQRIGDPALADFLRSDVESFGKNAERVTAATIYVSIKDAFIGLPGDPSFETVICVVSRDWGLTRKELRQRYPRSRRVYNDARRWRQLVTEARMARST